MLINILKLEWITAIRVSVALILSTDDIDKDEIKLHIYNTLTKDEERKYYIRRTYKNL